MNGWIKIHKKLRDHDLLRKDHSAFIVFMSLLLHCRTEKGTYDVGRFQLAQMTGLKPETARKALARLEKKWQIITTTSTNKYTEVTILNWAKYQQKEEAVTTSDTNKVPTKYQQSTTKKELRTKKQEKSSVADKPQPTEKVDQPMTLQNFIDWCSRSDQRHVRIIGEWADTERPALETREQWNTYLKRHLRPAKLLVPFTDKQLDVGFQKIRDATKEGWLHKYTLETLLKFVT